MPVLQQTLFYYWSPGEWLQAVMGQFQTWIGAQFSGDPFTMDAVTYDTFQALICTLTNPHTGDEWRSTFVLASAPGEGFTPARFYLNDAAWGKGSTTSILKTVGTDMSIYPGFLESFWTQSVGEFLGAYCNSTITVVAVTSKEVAQGNLLTMTLSYEIEDNGEVLSDSIGVNVNSAESFTEAGYLTIVSQTNFSRSRQIGATGGGLGPSVERIVAALETIAMRRQDFSINHGQAINSSDGIVTG